MKKLASKRALVTGASSGLGAHFAQVLAAHGAHVVLAARRRDALEGVAQSIRDAGGEASVVVLDQTESASCDALVENAGSIDILINNAGVVTEGVALNQTEADWDTVIDTNLKGQFFVAQAVARDMQSRGGSIVNIASILGLRQSVGVLPYAVSKAGVVQMTKTLALE
ncbi:MAG: SDR family NAD(P)-dependent oxidoreductase, partial [Burkholderiaceae bacterium]